MPIAVHRSLMVGLDALRVNPLRTLLSTLGVVMGVAAVVSVLSRGDGVERFARQQIEETTDLLGVSIVPTANTIVDGQVVRRGDVPRFTRDDARVVAAVVEGEASVSLVTTGSVLVAADSVSPPRGFGVTGTLASHFADAGLHVVAGRGFADTDTAVVVLNDRAAGVLARVVAGDSTAVATAVGRPLVLNERVHTVIGVVTGGRRSGTVFAAYVPVDDAGRTIPGMKVPSITLVAREIGQVERIRLDAERWMGARYGDRWKDRAAVNSNEARVRQASMSLQVFKLLMGAIAGVSLLVGGVGIMNVLLASVAERTREIGVRKAAGARRRDIMVQFLAESVAITAVGASIGVVLGLGIAFSTAAVMRA